MALDNEPNNNVGKMDDHGVKPPEGLLTMDDHNVRPLERPVSVSVGFEKPAEKRGIHWAIVACGGGAETRGCSRPSASQTPR